MFERELAQHLSSLSSEKLIWFSLWCCLRQMSVYQKASQEQSWGRLIQLKEILRLIWLTSISDRGFDQRVDTEIQRIDAEIGAWIPEDVSCSAEHAALSCITSIGLLLRMCRNEASISCQVECATEIAEETIEILFQIDSSINRAKGFTSDSDMNLESHLIEDEKMRQINDFKFMQEASLTKDVLEEIYDKNRSLDLTSGLWFLD